MSSKPKNKDHRRQDGGGKKGRRGLSPAEQEGMEALSLGRQAKATPAQDAPVVAVEPGDRSVYRAADGGLVTDTGTHISGEALRQAADAAISTPVLDAPVVEPVALSGNRQEPTLGDLDTVEVAQSAPAPAPAPARPQGRVSVLALQGVKSPAAKQAQPASAPAKPAAPVGFGAALAQAKAAPEAKAKVPPTTPRRKVWKWLMWGLAVVFTLLGGYVALRAGWAPRPKPWHAWAVVAALAAVAAFRLGKKFLPGLKKNGSLLLSAVLLTVDIGVAWWAGYQVFDMIEFAGTRMVPAIIVGGLVGVVVFVLLGYILMALALIFTGEPKKKAPPKEKGAP